MLIYSIPKINLNTDTIYDPSNSSNVSFHVGDDISNLLFSYEFFIFLHEWEMLKFDIVIYS